MNGTRISPQAISRALTNAGLVTSHAERRFRYDGLYVSRDASGGVVVNVDLSGDAHRAQATENITTVLAGKGYACRTVNDDGYTAVYVTR